MLNQKTLRRKLEARGCRDVRVKRVGWRAWVLTFTAYTANNEPLSLAWSALQNFAKRAHVQGHHVTIEGRSLRSVAMQAKVA